MQLANLEKLSLHTTSIGPRGISTLRQASWPKFRHLILCGTSYSDVEDLSKANWPLLSSLDLSQGVLCSLSESMPDAIAGNWPLLESLDLSDSDIGSECLALLSEAHWPCLKSLYIQNNCSNPVDSDVVPVVKMLTRAAWPLLERLDISGASLNREAANLLITCPWPHLCHLKFSSSDSDENGFTQMIKGNWYCFNWYCLNLVHKHVHGVSKQEVCVRVSSMLRSATMQHLKDRNRWRHSFHDGWDTSATSHQF